MATAAVLATAPASTAPRESGDRPPVLPLVDALPRLAAFALVALGLVGTPLLLLDRFDRLPVLAGSAVLLVALELGWRRTAPRRAEVPRRVLVVSLLALLVAVLSTGLNARYASEHLLVDGDSAVYAVTGQLIAETGSLRIDTRAETLFGGVSLNYAGSGFDAYAGETVVRPSFMHLLPQVLAVASWAGGLQALLWANAVVSGFALLAVFAFGARLLRRPEWSLVATTALTLTLPQQHFSRDTFSELPAQLLVFAGLALLHDAVRSRRAVPGLLAGLVLGVSCLARIDAFFYLVPLTAFATVLVLAGAARVAAGLVAGVAVGAAMGYADLRIGSPTYLDIQSGNLDMIFVALAATALGCAVVLGLRRSALALWHRLSGRALAWTVAGVVVLLSLYAGLLRPDVETGRGLSPLQPTAVAQLQERAGLPVDPLQSYDELSLQWLTWYLGPVAVALGLLAFAVLVWRALRRQPSARAAEGALLGLAFLLLFGATTALYLWRPSIVPVHYWATRRFLPVTIPGLLLLAAWLVPAVRGRGRAPVGAAVRAAVAVGVAAALLVPPVVYLQGHLRERDYAGMLAAVEQLCDSLAPDDAVLLVGGTNLSTALPQAVSTYCGVPVAVMDRPTTRADVQATAAAVSRAGRRLVLMSNVPDPVLVDGPLERDWSLVVDTDLTVVALSLLERPDEEFTFPLQVFTAPAG